MFWHNELQTKSSAADCHDKQEWRYRYGLTGQQVSEMKDAVSRKSLAEN